jgi:hypothetical protein
VFAVLELPKFPEALLPHAHKDPPVLSAMLKPKDISIFDQSVPVPTCIGEEVLATLELIPNLPELLSPHIHNLPPPIAPEVYLPAPTAVQSVAVPNLNGVVPLFLLLVPIWPILPFPNSQSWFVALIATK